MDSLVIDIARSTPILEVDRSAAVIVLKRSMASGFAGIDKPLFYDPKTSLLFGDAKASVAEITAEVQALQTTRTEVARLSHHGGFMTERLAIAGAGAIGTGLAAALAAAAYDDMLLWARSEASRTQAAVRVEQILEKLPDLGDAGRVRYVADLESLAAATFVIEAIAEDHQSKVALLARLGALTGPQTVLATTTSSLPIADLARRSGRGESFVGFHVFNPVARMQLVELVFGPQTSREVRDRARGLCVALGKTAVEVPDVPGFVVNRLLFPYLFSAVELVANARMEPADVDLCMTLGTGMPMGPLALLDFVGLDVAEAIGRMMGSSVPALLEDLVQAGRLGRKTRQGFYAYD